VKRNVGFRCPTCGRKFAGIEGMDDATQVIRRTCRNCRSRWQIKITPRAVDVLGVKAGAYIDTGELVELERTP
jgi:DNA-directed RNA polymerase subunit RPC12/RpoP